MTPIIIFLPFCPDKKTILSSLFFIILKSYEEIRKDVIIITTHFGLNVGQNYFLLAILPRSQEKIWPLNPRKTISKKITTHFLCSFYFDSFSAGSISDLAYVATLEILSFQNNP